jgi:hypothetical protein
MCAPAPSGGCCRSLSVEAFEAIAATLPFGSVSYENETSEKGKRSVWLNKGVVDRLRSLWGAGESYSDVIPRLASESVV